MALLSRSQIDALSDLPKELVPVPEWGGEVYARTLTVAERVALESGDPAEGNASAVVRLVALSMCDADGVPLYGGDPAGVEALGKKNANALVRVKDVALRLNAITPADVEALEKNS